MGAGGGRGCGTKEIHTGSIRRGGRKIILNQKRRSVSILVRNSFPQKTEDQSAYVETGTRAILL